MPDFSNENLLEMMQYHSPDHAQETQHNAVNEASFEFAKLIRDSTPRSAEQTLAIRAIQEVRFWANSAIAHRGKF